MRHAIDITANDTDKVVTWNLLSQQNSNMGYYILAEKSAYEALALATKMGYTKGMGRANYYIGISYSKRNKYDVAMAYYLKAIPLYEKIRDTSGIAYTTMLIGVIEYYLKNYSKAEVHYQKALKLFESSKNRLGVANCLVNLSILYYYSGDYDKALEYSQKSYKLFDGSPHGKAVAMSNIANTYVQLYLQQDSLGNKDLANEYFARALKTYNSNIKIYTELGQPVEKSGQYKNIFELYFQVKEYDLARKYLDSAYMTIKDVNNIEGLKIVYNGYYLWYLQRGDSAAALNYYLKYTAAKDSVFNSEKAEKLDALNVEMAELEKQKEIDDLTKQKEKRGLILWGVGLLAILAIAFSFLFFKRFREKQAANLLLSEKNEIIENKNKEIIDSINYAKRIQKALMPNDKYVGKTLERLRKNG